MASIPERWYVLFRIGVLPQPQKQSFAICSNIKATMPCPSTINYETFELFFETFETYVIDVNVEIWAYDVM